MSHAGHHKKGALAMHCVTPLWVGREGWAAVGGLAGGRWEMWELFVALERLG